METNSEINSNLNTKILYSVKNSSIKDRNTNDISLRYLNDLNTENLNSSNFDISNNITNSLIKRSYFSGNLPMGKKMKILKRLESIDDKIKFGLINVVPKKSLLNINENKFLKYKDIEKDIKKREKEIKLNLQKSTNKTLKNLTSFQKNEIDRIILKEKIKFKKDIYVNHENLLKNIIDQNQNEENELMIQSKIK